MWWSLCLFVLCIPVFMVCLGCSATTRDWIGSGSKPYDGFPPVHRRSPDSEYLYITRSTGVVPLGPSDGKVIPTEWSYENEPFAEVDDPSGSVVDTLKTDPVGSTGGSGWHPNPEPDSHLPAAATGPPPLEAMSFLVEAGNGRSKRKTTKTLPASAAAWSRKKRPIKWATKNTVAIPTSGRSESHGAASPAALCLEVWRKGIHFAFAWRGSVNCWIKGKKLMTHTETRIIQRYV